MRNIEDLEHFVLAEGETLILRCTRPFSPDQLVQMRATIERFLPGRPVLIVPPNIEVCAGKLEVWGAEDEARAEADAQTQEQLRRDEIHRAYVNGKMVYARDTNGDVFVIQRAAFPHTIDFDRHAYALTEKELRQ